MSPEAIGVYGFIVLFILMALGLPIGVAMGMVGFFGLVLILPFQAAVSKMAIAPFDLVSSYAFATLPLFLLMGHVLLATGQGGNLFSVAKKWFGRTPGGLAMATVAGCAAFGAVCASSIATAVTLGLVAIPEMKKAKYDGGFANATVAAGGTIGSLIPPSGFMIIYGILTENSIAKLFVGGIIPGIIVSLSYIVMIGLRCYEETGPGTSRGEGEHQGEAEDAPGYLGTLRAGRRLDRRFALRHLHLHGGRRRRRPRGVSIGNREAEPYVAEDQRGCPRDNEDFRYDLRSPDRGNPF